MSGGQVVLSCGCKPYYDPLPISGDEVFCPRHNSSAWVRSGGQHSKAGNQVSDITGEYWNRCLNCKYSRFFGRGYMTAEAKAAAHRARHPTHTVVITAPDGTRHKTYAPPAGQVPLPEDGDVPPF